MWLRHEKSLLLTKIVMFPVPRECTMCGSDVAQYECKKCYQKGLLKDGPGIASYCKGCHEKVHGHRNRQDHNPKPILLPRVYGYYSDQKKTGERQITFLKQKMDLFAVVCIETSHYVAFVKCGMDENAPWCFFDSMADRKGESANNWRCWSPLHFLFAFCLFIKARKVHKNHQKFKTGHDETEIMRSYAYCAYQYHSAEIR